MASIPRKTKLTRGPWAGFYAVRWRPTRTAAQQTGYLPATRLLDAYTDYEASCWAAGDIADAPEVHFAELVQRELAKRTGRIAAAETATAGPAAPPLANWVGTIDEPGPFFKASIHQHGDGQLTHLVRLVGRDECATAAATPLDRLTYTAVEELFHQWMACPRCVQRVVDAGQQPGRDVTWQRLVPRRNERATWDRVVCDQHETDRREKTYELRRQAFGAFFNATHTVEARQLGFLPVDSPVPSKSTLFGKVIFRGRREGSGDGLEDLRYALAHHQVMALCDASPPELRPLPLVSANCLSRGGQEMFGTRIRDFLPENPFIVSDLAAAPCQSMLNVHNFRSRNRLPGAAEQYVNRDYGKTDLARREAPQGRLATSMMVEHIRTYRSTPSPDCEACRAGHRHWATNDHHNNPHRGCDFDPDAPMWVDAAGEWMRADVYTSDVWPDMCQRAGLTEDVLGWKPLPRHARATGATMYVEQPNPDISLILKLGGWTNEETFWRHYERCRPAVKLAAAQALEDAHVLPAPGDDATPQERSDFERRSAEREIDRLRRLLIAAGIDPDSEVEPTPLPSRQSRHGVTNWVGREIEFVEIVEQVVLDGGGGKSELLDRLGVAPAGSNYRRLAAEFERIGLPDIPPNHALKGADRRAPYEAELRAAIDRVRVGDVTTVQAG